MSEDKIKLLVKQGFHNYAISTDYEFCNSVWHKLLFFNMKHTFIILVYCTHPEKTSVINDSSLSSSPCEKKFDEPAELLRFE